MGTARNGSEVDLAALLSEVHGQTEHEARAEQMEAALKAMEDTHRRASVAIRQFERTGRTSLAAETAALALSALADDSLAPSQAEGKAAPIATEVTAVDVISTTQARAAAPQLEASEPTRTWVADLPEASAREHRAAPAAPRKPPLDRHQPAGAHDEPTQIVVAPKAPARPDPSTRAAEPLAKAPESGSARPAPVAPAPERRTSAAPVADPSLLPATVYTGRGADISRREPTRTQIIKGRK